MSTSSSSNIPPSDMPGEEIIRRAMENAGTLPGVYRMLDAKGNALYVGKAKQLKHRLSAYTQPERLGPRLQRMVSLTRAVELTLTQTEAEALLLEANLIKRLKPRFNILLRDDKSFPFLFISSDHPYPRIAKHRGAKKEKGEYFGPFASVRSLNESIAILQRAFLLRPCSDNVFKSRTRPCLQYQIKRCSGPCVKKISEEDYAALVGEARDFLHGKSRQIQERLQQEMQAASEALAYEDAAQLRDRIAALTRVQREHDIHASTLAEADVMALAREGGQVCVQVFFFRAGQNFGNHAFFPAHAEDASEADVLGAFIGQFYQTRMPPKEILLSHDVEGRALIEEALAGMAGHKVALLIPERGEKMDVMRQVLKNAEQSLKRRLAERMGEAALLEKVSELFALDGQVKRIEVYDNSHIMGSHPVGAMVVAGPEGFEKKSYRKFSIHEKVAPGDDYAMLREVLTRRLTKLVKEDPANEGGAWPDLMLIDGGAGQLSIASQVMADLGISDITYAAISKGPDRNAGREWFHVPDKEPFQLPVGDPVLHYLQRLRDEAHRFAIGSHRNKRSKSITQSALDDIPGIGGTRKKALLNHFGSRAGAEEASVSDLMKVPGISKKTAEAIWNYFRG